MICFFYVLFFLLVPVSPALLFNLNFLGKVVTEPERSRSVSSIEVYYTSEQVWFTDKSSASSLRLYIKNNGLLIANRDSHQSTANGNFLMAEAIFGIFQLPLGYCIALVTDSTSVIVDGFSGIREVKSIELLPICRDIDAATLPGKKQKEAFDLISQTLSRHKFYYSTGTDDISRPVQSNALHKRMSWRDSDDRFFWNRNLVSELIRAEDCDECWIVPFVNAIIQQSHLLNSRGVSYNLTLISRRSRLYQGPRYIKRGSDVHGNAANVVETEQVLKASDGKLSSFVQIRGSIPLFWGQPETWKLKPTIIPARNVKMNAQATKSHILDLLCRYGYDNADHYRLPAVRERARERDKNGSYAKVSMINLIDKTGTQGELGKWFWSSVQRANEVKSFSANPSSSLRVAEDSDAAGTKRKSAVLLTQSDVATIDEAVLLEDVYSADDALPRHIENDSELRDRNVVSVLDIGLKRSLVQESALRLIWFDYHRKCKGGNIDSLREIFPLIEPAIFGSGGFYSWVTPGKQVQYQDTIIRTNCVDCLDRTNVVQSAVARAVLLCQLSQLGAIEAPGLAPAIARVSSSATIASPHARQDALITTPLPDPTAEQVFRRMWGANGDSLSLLYAGTHALKRDVTLLGRRTRGGALADGVNSVMRYFINNYADVRRQRGIDFLLGITDVMGNRLAPLVFSSFGDQKGWVEAKVETARASDEVTKVSSNVTVKKKRTAVASTTKHKRTNTLNILEEMPIGLQEKKVEAIFASQLNATSVVADTTDMSFENRLAAALEDILDLL